MPSLDARGFLLTSSYRRRAAGLEIELVGVLEDGSTFTAIETRARPYFFVPAAARAEVADLAPAETALRALDGAPVVRIETRDPGDLPRLRDGLRARGVTCFEADIRFAQRFLMDRGVRAGLRLRGLTHAGRHTAHLLTDPEIDPDPFTPSLRVLALDIETSTDGEHLYSVSLAGDGVHEVLMRHDREVRGARVFPDERSLLEELVRSIRAIDPDVLTGWSVIDFDLRALDRFARRAHVPLALGRASDVILFQRDQTFTFSSRASVPGRQVLDGMLLVRDAGVKLDEYGLDAVARHALGRGKQIGPVGKLEEIERCYREDPEKLAAYNLDDSELVLQILRKLSLVELCVERSRLTGMPLDRVSASVASFDSLYLPPLRRRGYVAPSVSSDREPAEVEGGYVLESRPGLHSWIAVFDYRSLYPSLMRTFNIDPISMALASTDPDPIVAPNGARFARARGILPELIEELWQHRDRARQTGRPLASYAIKILMNSLFGVFGTPGCRFFSPAIANAITHFGQWLIQLTREVIGEQGFEVIYGDTDSLFVATRAASEPEARAACAGLLEKTRAEVARRIADRHRVTPRVELTLAKLYHRFLMPELRASARGSKKRYAGLLAGEAEEPLDVVGLEAVRRDCPVLVRELQRELLLRLFRDEAIEPYLRALVADLEAGRLDAKLVIKKGLGKSLEEYTATTPPHVKAALYWPVERGALGEVCDDALRAGAAARGASLPRPDRLPPLPRQAPAARGRAGAQGARQDLGRGPAAAPAAAPLLSALIHDRNRSVRASRPCGFRDFFSVRDVFESRFSWWRVKRSPGDLRVKGRRIASSTVQAVRGGLGDLEDPTWAVGQVRRGSSGT
ncbi:MAG: DNA polymerase II [Planctomycetota bacterium]